jgi:hypothetical protein
MSGWLASWRALQPRSRELLIVLIFVVAAELAVFLNLPVPIRAVMTAPLAFVLPGIAFLAASMPTARLQGVERLLISLALSIAIAVLLGLAMGLAGVQLIPETWAASLGLLTLSAAAVGWLRRPATEPPIEKARRVDRRFLSLVGMAVVLTILVVGVTRYVTVGQEAVAPPQLWIQEGSSPNTVSVGIKASSEGGEYRLRVTSGGNLIDEVDVPLGPSSAWSKDIPVTDENLQRPIVARLFRAGEEAEILFVVLQGESGSG